MAKLAPGLKPRPGSRGETTPALLLATAASYASAAEAADEKKSQNHIPALYLLSAFSIELSLKAFILSQTGDAKELSDIGHDLSKAWKRARSLGLDVSTSIIPLSDFDWLIEAVAPHHKAMTFRYMPNVQTFTSKAAPPDMMKGAGALCAIVARSVQIS